MGWLRMNGINQRGLPNTTKSDGTGVEVSKYSACS